MDTPAYWSLIRRPQNAPPHKEKKKEKNQTIRLFIFKEEGGKKEILLVHEKGDQKENSLGREDELEEKEKGETNSEKESEEEKGKPPGWGLSGGGVNGKREQETIDAILNFLPVYAKIPSEQVANVFADLLRSAPATMDLIVCLVGIKEGIEETGFAVSPQQVLFKRSKIDHEDVVVEGKIIAGELMARSMETDDCRWFPLDSLPKDIYESHLRMVIRSFYQMGMPEAVKLVKRAV